MSKLLVGLGNPGNQYAQTNHNIGFRVIDKWLSRFGTGAIEKSKFNSDLAEIGQGQDKIFTLKPRTYMNLSGQAVGECSRFFKIDPSVILVVSDDIELPIGKLRYRAKGGHGGHNGLRDIIRIIGADFHRLKIGVGKPDQKEQVSGHVLSAPDKATADLLNVAEEKAAEALEQFIAKGVIVV